MVSKGHILGLEEEARGKIPTFRTGAVCSAVNPQTSHVEIYKIERELFFSLLKSTQIWDDLIKKSKVDTKGYLRNIRSMKHANL